MKKTLMKVLFAIALIGALLALAACGAADENGGVIGSVNGEKIYQSEYDYYLADYYDYYYSYYMNYYGMDMSDQELVGTYMPTLFADLEHYSWERCVEAAFIRQIAKNEYDITYDNDYLADFLPFGEYMYMETNGLYSQLAASEEVQAAAAAAAEAAYNADPREYRGTSHILIACDDVDDPEALATAYEQAMEVIQMLQNGADFDDMVTAYSADGNASYDPIDADGAMIDGSTNFVKEYAQGAFGLSAVGEYTLEPVLSVYGYHIIRLDSIVSSFEDAEPYLVNVSNYLTDLLDQYKEDADIECKVEFKYYDPNGDGESADADTDEASDDAADADTEEADK